MLSGSYDMNDKPYNNVSGGPITCLVVISPKCVGMGLSTLPIKEQALRLAMILDPVLTMERVLYCGMLHHLQISTNHLAASLPR